MKRRLRQVSSLVGLTMLAIGLSAGQAMAQSPAQSDRIESQSGIADLNEVPGVIVKVLIFFLPAVATLYLILSGYRYIIAQGNPDLIEKAKKSLTYAIYGVLLAYASAVLILLVGEQLNLPTELDTGGSGSSGGSPSGGTP